MTMNSRELKKIRVLVVDDSRLFRNTLKKALEGDPAIEVVGMASDPYEARDKILELRPDVMTLDVQMPKMNGLEFLKKLMPQYPMPVVVVSSANGIVFDALKAGAVDFVEKPSKAEAHVVEAMIAELIEKVKVASGSNVQKKSRTKNRRQRRTQTTPKRGITNKDNKKMIAIGASTGGTEAIFEVIKQFPADCPPTIIVQHMPPVFTKLYAERMDQSCAVNVLEAKDGDWLMQGTVLIAPGEYHMRLEKHGKRFKVRLSSEEKVNGHRPSVDVMFSSVAKLAAECAVGVILTGMGKDGAKGLLEMRKCGSRTIGQDSDSSIVYGMPKVAFDLGAVEYQMPLAEISSQILKLLIE